MPIDRSQSTFSPRNGVLVALIAFAVGMRLFNHFVPGLLPYNFTPVEAIALFGGAYFADRRFAFVVPLAAMLLTDLVIAWSLPAAWVRDWLHTLPAVYLCIGLTVFGGLRLRDRVSGPRVAAYGFAGAVLFFLVTNFAVWLAPDPAEGGACLSGLAACYVAGIPFFKGTLLGTLFWSGVLFGGFELLRWRWPRLQTA